MQGVEWVFIECMRCTGYASPPVYFRVEAIKINRHQMQEHKDRVAQISKQVKRFWALQEPFRIYHGSTYSTRFSRRERNSVVDISLLTNILDISIAERSVLVEANVSMDKLLDFTIKHRLIPPVVPELPGMISRQISQPKMVVSLVRRRVKLCLVPKCSVQTRKTIVKLQRVFQLCPKCLHRSLAPAMSSLGTITKGEKTISQVAQTCTTMKILPTLYRLAIVSTFINQFFCSLAQNWDTTKRRGSNASTARLTTDTFVDAASLQASSGESV